jgi:hypothetical protein
LSTEGNDDVVAFSAGGAEEPVPDLTVAPAVALPQPDGDRRDEALQSSAE